MPRRSTRVASDGLRQTTLLEVPPSNHLTPGRPKGPTRRKKVSRPSSGDFLESSSDNLAAISFAPETNKTTPIGISSDDDSPAPMPKVPPKRKSKRIISESSSELEAQAGPSSKISASQGSDNENDRPSRKRRRLQRLQPLEESSASEENLVDLANEVEEESTPMHFFAVSTCFLFNDNTRNTTYQNEDARKDRIPKEPRKAEK